MNEQQQSKPQSRCAVRSTSTEGSSCCPTCWSRFVFNSVMKEIFCWSGDRYRLLCSTCSITLGFIPRSSNNESQSTECITVFRAVDRLENKDRWLKIISFAYWQAAERFHLGVHVHSVLLWQQIWCDGYKAGNNTLYLKPLAYWWKRFFDRAYTPEK